MAHNVKCNHGWQPACTQTLSHTHSTATACRTATNRSLFFMRHHPPHVLLDDFVVCVAAEFAVLVVYLNRKVKGDSLTVLVASTLQSRVARGLWSLHPARKPRRCKTDAVQMCAVVQRQLQQLRKRLALVHSAPGLPSWDRSTCRKGIQGIGSANEQGGEHRASKPPIVNGRVSGAVPLPSLSVDRLVRSSGTKLSPAKASPHHIWRAAEAGGGNGLRGVNVVPKVLLCGPGGSSSNRAWAGECSRAHGSAACKQQPPPTRCAATWDTQAKPG